MNVELSECLRNVKVETLCHLIESTMGCASWGYLALALISCAPRASTHLSSSPRFAQKAHNLWPILSVHPILT